MLIVVYALDHFITLTSPCVVTTIPPGD